MNYNLLTSSDLNAAQITSEVTEQVVTKTNRWISFWNEHVPDLISFGVEIGFSLLIFFVGRFLIRWIRRIVRRSIERSSADTGVEQFIDSLLNFSSTPCSCLSSFRTWAFPPLPSPQSLLLPA